MKVRVKRDGLLGIVVHKKGTEIDVRPEQWRVWMEPLDDEGMEIKAKWETSQRKEKLSNPNGELATLKARIRELESEPPKDKRKKRVQEDVI